MMNAVEVDLARRIIGLRGTAFKARKNNWRRKYTKDAPVILSLQRQQWAEQSADDSWKLTPLGIQQLKLQIGEFTFTG